jgi:hypothetical protein
LTWSFAASIAPTVPVADARWLLRRPGLRAPHSPRRHRGQCKASASRDSPASSVPCPPETRMDTGVFVGLTFDLGDRSSTCSARGFKRFSTLTSRRFDFVATVLATSAVARWRSLTGRAGRRTGRCGGRSRRLFRAEYLAQSVSLATSRAVAHAAALSALSQVARRMSSPWSCGAHARSAASSPRRACCDAVLR